MPVTNYSILELDRPMTLSGITGGFFNTTAEKPVLMTTLSLRSSHSTC